MRVSEPELLASIGASIPMGALFVHGRPKKELGPYASMRVTMGAGVRCETNFNWQFTRQ